MNSPLSCLKGRVERTKAPRRIALEEAAFAAVFLTAAWYVFFFATVWALRDYFVDGDFLAYTQGPGIHIEMLAMGLGFGCLFAFINLLSEGTVLRHQPFGQIILIKAGFYLLGILGVMVAVNVISLLFLYSWDELQELLGPRLTPLVGGQGELAGIEPSRPDFSP